MGPCRRPRGESAPPENDAGLSSGGGYASAGLPKREKFLSTLLVLGCTFFTTDSVQRNRSRR